MAINVDLTETQHPESVGEFIRVAPGAAHLMVVEAKENGGAKGEHVVKIEVLQHSDPNEIGKTHTEQFPATPNMAWKILSFAYAVKIADREAMGRAKAAGTAYAPIDLKAAEGRQFFGTFKASEKEGKTFINLNDMLAIDDPKADKHPRNPGMLKQAGIVAGASTAATTTNQAAKPAAAAAANPFANV